MKRLGTKQYQQMTFKYLDIPDEWRGLLGNILRFFICIIYGRSGNGKTEFCVRLAKMLVKFGDVAWISYEQGHGGDLQAALNRNKMEEAFTYKTINGKKHIATSVIWVDPNAKRQPGKTYLQELCEWLDKKNAPKFIFIDSLKYTGWGWDDYKHLKENYGHKVSFIFIDHADTIKEPRRQIAKDIEFDGHLGLSVDRYIVHVNKSRFSSTEPYIVWEERARELNPAFFLKHDNSKPKQSKQITLKVVESAENEHLPPTLSTGVDAEITPKTASKRALKTPLNA